MDLALNNLQSLMCHKTQPTFIAIVPGLILPGMVVPFLWPYLSGKKDLIIKLFK